MVAVIDDEDAIARRKRKSSQSTLSLFCEVEVRSLNEKRLGSWESGKVIACDDQSRLIEFNHILCPGSSDKLTESIPLSPVVDGFSTENYSLWGRIRPFPPFFAFDLQDLVYGLCVDVHFEESWWDAVIFDHNDGSSKRNVFFPDLGEELIAGVSDIRISQDWNEDDDSWRPRGIWYFLQSVEDCAKKSSHPFSVIQIWHDLQKKEGFGKVKESTGGDKSFWRNLVLESVSANLGICLEEVSTPTLDSRQEKLTLTEYAEPVPELDSADEQFNNWISVAEDDEYSTVSKSSNWKPISKVLVPEPKFNPDSVIAYLKKGNERNHSLLMDVRQHLLFMGWCMEFAESKKKTRVRYYSPSGKVYYSLIKLCQEMKESDELVPRLTYKETEMNVSVCQDLNSIDTERSVVVVDSPNSRDNAHGDQDESLHFEPVYCPEAVVDYYKLKSVKGVKGNGAAAEELRLKVRQHLAATGWRFFYRYKFRKRELIYESPQKKKLYSSLLVVCKDCIDDGRLHEKSSKGTTRGKKIIGFIAENKNKVDDNICGHKRKRSSAKVREIPKTRKSTRVLRSSKRVKKCPLQQNPKNLISWLIDNNIMLPRAKVYCRDDTGARCLGEGRFHHDGIRCNCCNGVFTLRGFSLHAGSTYKNPSARTFLEDGRSLLDCQMQIFQEKASCLVKEPEGDASLGENDNICSVCHYGGDLILCDRCPSAFHKACLGLEDIPDGDWFCPTCCCQDCGQSKLNSTDCTVLTCDQCECKYHVECLKKRSKVELLNLPTKNWYCSKKCKKISVGLSELIGKPIMVGDGLQWTLLKFMVPNSHHHPTKNPDLESCAENYVKLNIALDVMHECFETVNEPYTKRDLIEDVIFSRGSELNRLNFRGFYTVILEKNDELVTAANLRVHGDKAAELPLIATRFKFRRLGMCRVMMNELEKNLKELGVERLILPAVPSVLKTWTDSFGFAKMTRLERLQLLGHTLLDFQDTVKCQKHLLKVESRASHLLLLTPTETADNNYKNKIDEICKEDAIEAAGNNEKKEESNEICMKDTIEAADNNKKKESNEICMEDAIAAAGNNMKKESSEICMEDAIEAAGNSKKKESNEICMEDAIKAAGNIQKKESNEIFMEDVIEAAGNNKKKESNEICMEDAIEAAGNIKKESDEICMEDAIEAAGNIKKKESDEICQENVIFAAGNIKKKESSEICMENAICSVTSGVVVQAENAVGGSKTLEVALCGNRIDKSREIKCYVRRKYTVAISQIQKVS